MNFRRLETDIFLTPDEAKDLGIGAGGVMIRIIAREDIGFDGVFAEEPVGLDSLSLFEVCCNEQEGCLGRVRQGRRDGIFDNNPIGIKLNDLIAEELSKMLVVL